MIKEYEWSNHEEWLAIRRQYIGGSDAGAVIGMNPYKSSYTLWAEKTGTSINGCPNFLFGFQFGFHFHFRFAFSVECVIELRNSSFDQHAKLKVSNCDTLFRKHFGSRLKSLV